MVWPEEVGREGAHFLAKQRAMTGIGTTEICSFAE